LNTGNTDNGEVFSSVESAESLIFSVDEAFWSEYRSGTSSTNVCDFTCNSVDFHPSSAANLGPWISASGSDVVDDSFRISQQSTEVFIHKNTSISESCSLHFDDSGESSSNVFFPSSIARSDIQSHWRTFQSSFSDISLHVTVQSEESNEGSEYSEPTTEKSEFSSNHVNLDELNSSVTFSSSVVDYSSRITLQTTELLSYNSTCKFSSHSLHSGDYSESSLNLFRRTSTIKIDSKSSLSSFHSSFSPRSLINEMSIRSEELKEVTSDYEYSESKSRIHLTVSDHSNSGISIDDCSFRKSMFFSSLESETGKGVALSVKNGDVSLIGMFLSIGVLFVVGCLFFVRSSFLEKTFANQFFVSDLDSESQ
jgi:hypothetical protein